MEYLNFTVTLMILSPKLIQFIAFEVEGILILGRYLLIVFCCTNRIASLVQVY